MYILEYLHSLFKESAANPGQMTSCTGVKLEGWQRWHPSPLTPPLKVSSAIFAFKELYLRPNQTSQILFGINSLNDILESVVGFMHVT